MLEKLPLGIRMAICFPFSKQVFFRWKCLLKSVYNLEGFRAIRVNLHRESNGFMASYASRATKAFKPDNLAALSTGV